MSRNAVDNNFKLFPLFKKHLADARHYVSTAEKLKLWMSKDKAYYPDAKPWILDFLETALSTVARLGGGDFSRGFHISKCAPSEFLRPYIELVETLARFRSLFTEPPFLQRVDELIRTIEPLTPSAPTASVGMYMPYTGSSSGIYSSPAAPHTPSYSPIASPQATSTFSASPLNFRSPGPFARSITAPVVGQSANLKQEAMDVSRPSQSPTLLDNSMPLRRVSVPRLSTISPDTPGGPSTFAQGAGATLGGQSVSPSAPPISYPKPNSPATSASGSATSHAPVQKKKTKSRPRLSLDFLEADLDWYMEQKQGQGAKQEAKSEGQDKSGAERTLTVHTAESAQVPSVSTEKGSGVQEVENVLQQPAQPPESEKLAQAEAPKLTTTAEESQSKPTQEVRDGGHQVNVESSASAPSSKLDEIKGDSAGRGVSTIPDQDNRSAESKSNQPISNETAGGVATTPAAVSSLPSVGEPSAARPSSPSTSLKTATPAPVREFSAKSNINPLDSMSRGKRRKSYAAPELRFQLVRQGSSLPAAPSASTRQASLASSSSPSVSVAPVTPASLPEDTAASSPSASNTLDASQDHQPPAPANLASVVEGDHPEIQVEALLAATSDHKSPASRPLVIKKDKSKSGPPGLKELPPAQQSPSAEAERSSSPTVSAGRSVSPSASRKIRSKKGPPGVKSLEELEALVAASEVDAGPSAPPAVESDVAVGEDGLLSGVRAAKRKDHPDAKDTPTNKKRKSSLPPTLADEATLNDAPLESVDMSVDGEEKMLTLEPASPRVINDGKEVVATEVLVADAVVGQVIMATAIRRPLSPPPGQVPIMSPSAMVVDLPGVHVAATSPIPEHVLSSEGQPTATEDKTEGNQSVDHRHLLLSSSGVDEACQGGIDNTSSIRTADSVQDSPQAASQAKANLLDILQPPQFSIKVGTGDQNTIFLTDSPEAASLNAPVVQAESLSSATSNLAINSSSPAPKAPSESITRNQQEPWPELAPSMQQTGTTFESRDYTVQSFVNGDFVYPNKSTPEPGEVADPSDHVQSPIVEERELGELTPIATVKALSDGIMDTPPAEPDAPLTWDSAVVKAAVVASVKQTQQLLDDRPGPYFTSSAEILGVARGSGYPQEPVIFEFSISDEQKQALTRWAARYETTDVSLGKCLSLSCYKFSRCSDELDRSPELSSAQEMFCGIPDVWPWNIWPWAELNEGKDFQKIGIWSVAVTKDQLVDISAKVLPGNNKLKIRYLSGDPHNWVFVLRLHDPTPLQVSELQSRRDSNLKWKNALQEMANIKLPPLKWPTNFKLPPRT